VVKEVLRKCIQIFNTKEGGAFSLRMPVGDIPGPEGQGRNPACQSSGGGDAKTFKPGRRNIEGSPGEEGVAGGLRDGPVHADTVGQLQGMYIGTKRLHIRARFINMPEKVPLPCVWGRFFEDMENGVLVFPRTEGADGEEAQGKPLVPVKPW